MRKVEASLELRWTFFRSKHGSRERAVGVFGWLYVLFRSLAVLTHLGAMWGRFGRVRASILEVFGAHFHQIFKLLAPTFSATLALC